jgi:transcriptional regulator with XRE-family HTH domain
MKANPNKQSAGASAFPKIVHLLKECGLNAAELARRVDVFPSTVSSWTTGKTATPGAVIAYLELLASIRRIG